MSLNEVQVGARYHAKVSGRLQVVLSELEPPPLPIHLVYPTTRLLSAKVRAFVDHAAATCDWRFVKL